MPDTTTDPVCGMTVEPPTKAGSVEHDGATYHFCGTGCREKFEHDPEAYLGEQPAKPAAPADPGDGPAAAPEVASASSTPLT